MIRRILAVAIPLFCLGPPATAQVTGPDSVALANAEFAIWQQVTDALGYQHGLGLADRKATLFALTRISAGGDAAAIERLLLIAETILVAEADGVLARDRIRTGLGGHLARQIICYVAGEGPGRAHALLAEWGEPRGGDDCATAIAEELEAAEAIGKAYPPGDGTPIPVRYGDDRWSELAAGYELLEEMSAQLAVDYAWPNGLTLEIIACGDRSDGYTDQTRTITLCSELIAHYHRLADGRIGY